MSLPERVVASAAALIASKCSSTQCSECARLAGVVEQEDGRALHRPGDDRRFHPAAFREKPHAAIVAGDQGSLGRRHGHVEFALGMLAVDPQRPGEPDRHLRHADEILDVAAENRGVEGEAADVVEPGFCLRLDEGAPVGRGFERVIIGGVAGNAGRVAGRGRGHRNAS